LLRLGSGAGVFDADAPRLAARRFVSLVRPGEFQTDECYAAPPRAVWFVIASGVVRIAQTMPIRLADKSDSLLDRTLGRLRVQAGSRQESVPRQACLSANRIGMAQTIAHQCTAMRTAGGRPIGTPVFAKHDVLDEVK